MRYLLTISITILFLFLGCSKDNPTTPSGSASADLSNSGAIKGRVLFDTSAGEAYIFILGADGVSMTDSNGNFKFQFLEPGTYTLLFNANSASDTVLKNVIVQAGKITDLGSIILHESKYSYSTRYDLSAYLTIDNNSNSYSRSLSYFYDDEPIDTLDVFGDSVFLEINSYGPYPGTYEVPYKLKIDGTIVKTGYTQKLTARIRLPLSSGCHLYELYADTSLCRCSYLRNSKVPGPFVTFSITNLSYSEEPDFDIILINQNNDTCWYKNSSPDWGNIGEISDNPIFSGDIKRFYNYSSYFESITLQHPTTGTYSLYVKNFYDSTITDNYYGNNSGIPSATININSVLDTISFTRDSLRPDQTWFVGRFKVPEMTFTKVDSVKIK